MLYILFSRSLCRTYHDFLVIVSQNWQPALKATKSILWVTVGCLLFGPATVLHIWQIQWAQDSSRFPIAVLPASRYAVSESGINLTLEAVATQIVSSFNRLSLHGIKVVDSQSMRSRAVSGLRFIMYFCLGWVVVYMMVNHFLESNLASQWFSDIPLMPNHVRGGLASLLCARFPGGLESDEGYVFFHPPL